MIKHCRECGRDFVAKGRLEYCELHRGKKAHSKRTAKLHRESTAITQRGLGRSRAKP